MHGHFNLPPFGIIEKRLMKNRVKQGVCNHHLLGNGEKQPVIHSSIWNGNEIAHSNHAQLTENNK